MLNMVFCSEQLVLTIYAIDSDETVAIANIMFLSICYPFLSLIIHFNGVDL